MTTIYCYISHTDQKQKINTQLRNTQHTTLQADTMCGNIPQRAKINLADQTEVDKLIGIT